MSPEEVALLSWPESLAAPEPPQQPTSSLSTTMAPSLDAMESESKQEAEPLDAAVAVEHFYDKAQAMDTDTTPDVASNAPYSGQEFDSELDCLQYVHGWARGVGFELVVYTSNGRVTEGDGAKKKPRASLVSQLGLALYAKNKESALVDAVAAPAPSSQPAKGPQRVYMR